MSTLDQSVDDFEAATGWAAKPEGMCKGDVCVPAPDAVADGRVDVGALSKRLGMALVKHETEALWSLGPEGGGKALTTATVPELELPDINGDPFKLSSLHGRKVLLVAWASW